jgi:pimeloyl-ACP methyl ester carboxylesterase
VTSPLALTESGTGDPVVLLHAFPLDSRMWDEQRFALADTYRVITPDLPGFGGSPLLEGSPSLDAVADAVAATLDSLDLDRVVLGGLSLGGYVAMAFLRRYPQRVRALVLADTKATADTEAGAVNRERIASTVVAERSLRVVLTDVLPGLVGKRTKRRRGEVLSRITDIVRESSPEAVAWTQRAMAARPDSLGTLAEVDVPALVLVGDEDELTPRAEADLMVGALPSARLVSVASAGHLSAMESPDDVTKALRTFLDALPA